MGDFRHSAEFKAANPLKMQNLNIKMRNDKLKFVSELVGRCVGELKKQTNGLTDQQTNYDCHFAFLFLIFDLQKVLWFGNGFKHKKHQEV
jgi:hypothetical protein